MEDRENPFANSITRERHDNYVSEQVERYAWAKTVDYGSVVSFEARDKELREHGYEVA